MQHICSSKQFCCTEILMGRARTWDPGASANVNLHSLRAAEPGSWNRGQARDQTKRRGAEAPRLAHHGDAGADFRSYIGFEPASGAMPSAFFTAARRRLRATFLTTRRTLRATFLTARRRLRPTRLTTRRTLRATFLPPRRRLRAVLRTARRTLRAVFLTLRRVLRVAFLVALLRVRFLAATMVFVTSSPAGGTGVVSVERYESSIRDVQNAAVDS